MQFLPSVNNFIGYILQVTESKYCSQNSRYVPLCDMVYFVPTWSLFAGPVTYCTTLDPIDYARFAQQRNKLRSFTRKLRHDYEVFLANGIKDNPKAFWHYINSKLKTRVSVESLHLDNGNVAVTDQDKADALNTHFPNVFTKEDLVNIPVMDNIYSSFPIADIPIHGEAIYNKCAN